MRSPLDLIGTSIDMTQGVWNNRMGGTGAGIDSFYEYLLKAYILFGKSDTVPAPISLWGEFIACMFAMQLPTCNMPI